MRIYRDLLKRRISKNFLLTMFFSGSGLFFNFAGAQNMVAKLTDSEIRTVIPILKAEITGYKDFMKGIEKKQDVNYKFFLDIQSGKTDPLDWLNKNSKHIIVPPGAIYQPACSREVSIKSKELFQDHDSIIRPSAVPTAVFTFGKDFPAINKQLAGVKMTNENYNKFRENPYDATDPSVDKLRLFIKEVDSFYTKNGFSVYYSPWDFLPGGTAFSFHHPVDEGYVSGFINIFDFTLLDPAYPDVVKLCGLNIMGPVIEISAERRLLDKIFSSSDSIKSIDENTRNSLKKAGLTEDRYAMIISSLMNARRDSEFPEGIEVPSLDFTPTTQEEKELAKTVAIMREDALARKNNITIYNTFKKELDPILDILEQSMY